MDSQKFPPWNHILALLGISMLVFIVVDSTPQSGAASAVRWQGRGPSSAAAPEVPAPPVIVRQESITAPILVYHNVRPRHEAPARVDEAYDITPEELDAHLAYLRDNGYVSVTQRDLSLMFDGILPVPEKPVLIGFDDGRDTHATYAEPLLAKYGFVATFFIFTNAIDREGYLTWDDLLRLEANGHEIASHTRYHPFLTKIDDPEELEQEIAGSKRTLDERLEQDVVSFAYPFGLWDDKALEAVKAAGYENARGLRHTETQTDTERYDLGGFIVTGPLSQLVRLLETE